ncbi:MAG TPA: MFS transporter [Acidimicrobiales bacterium]|nr:MFS transporter [Acidimicrobiales bacterium]
MASAASTAVHTRAPGRPRLLAGSPLQVRAFRWLWSSAIVSNTGVWIEAVMVGFVMARLTKVPSLVAALPAAASLPGVIFAIPSGAVSDATDRRLVLLSAKALFFLGTAGLALLAVAHHLSPLGLLAFTVLLGTFGTFSTPAWWATVGELVPERLLSRALSLDGLQWNIGQIVGPVLGGALLATIGAGGMFGISALLMTAVVAFLFVWRGRQRSRLSTPGQGAAERVAGAIAAGARYLSNAPALQVTCWRTVLFVLPAGALADLLPLLGARELGVGPIGYGLLLAAVGAGSVVSALVVPRLHERFHIDRMLGGATVLWVGCTTVLAVVDVRVVVAAALAGTGAGWLTAVTSLNMSAQRSVPDWVRSRALGAYLMVFQASILVGGLLWGGVADAIGVRTTLLVAAGALLPGVVAIRWLSLPAVDRRDLHVVARPLPAVGVEPDEAEGPVMILVEYEIDPDDEDGFIEAMEELRVVRRRTGATRWGLFEDAAQPGRFVETFVVASWGSYLRQRTRYTEADLRVHDAAYARHRLPGRPRVTYFIHPDSALAYRRRARWRRLRGLDRALSEDKAAGGDKVSPLCAGPAASRGGHEPPPAGARRDVAGD